MKFTTEMLEKAKAAKTAEELLELAKAENMEMTAEEAAKYFAELHKSGELSDAELDNVAGGCGDPGVKYSYDVGNVLIEWRYLEDCPAIHTYRIIERKYWKSFNTEWKYHPEYILENTYNGSTITVGETELGTYYERLS